MPVNTIASPSRSAAAITSGSRTEPPGWITAVAPAFAASSTPSGNGKNASEATTLPASGVCAFITAIFTESTRLICPAPTPSVAPSFANTMAFDFTCLHTFHANRIVRSSSAVGARLVTVRSSPSLISPRSGCCTSIPPRIRLSCNSRSGSNPPGGSSSNRKFFFAAKSALAFSSNPGAAIHSTNSFATSSAVAASTTRLNASTPPNAETGSHARAFKYASSSVFCSAVPQGLLCLMITVAGFSNSAARLRAASKSTKLLYDSSFPWSCFAAANPSGVRPSGPYNAAAWCGFSPYLSSCCRRRAMCTRSGNTGFSPSAMWPAAESRSSSVVIIPSYRDVVANTFRASSSRVVSAVSPVLSSSFATRSKSVGSVTTVTHSKFFRGQPALRRRRLERIQIHDQQIDRLDPVLGRLFLVIGMVSPEEQSPVHLWVQRFHPPAQHLRPAREIRNVAHRHARLAQQLRRSTRRKNFYTQRLQPLRKLHDSCLVKHADQRALHRHVVPPRKGKALQSKRMEEFPKAQTSRSSSQALGIRELTARFRDRKGLVRGLSTVDCEL